MRVWSICDRCSFRYYSRQLVVESTGVLVCEACDDRNYDLKRHPQNRPARTRRELLAVPNGRNQQIPMDVLAMEDEGLLLTEDGYAIEVTGPVWTPSMSVGD